MTDEKGHIHRDIEKLKPGEFTVMGTVIMAVIAVFIAIVLEQDKTEIDSQKDIYLFLHGRMDLQEKAVTRMAETEYHFVTGIFL